MSAVTERVGRAEVERFVRSWTAEDRWLRFFNHAESSADWLIRALDDPEHRTLVVREHGEVIALLDFIIDRDVEFGLVVAAPYRRRRYGTLLTTALVDEARRDVRAARIVCHALPENVPMHAILRRLGFERAGLEAPFRFALVLEPATCRSSGSGVCPRSETRR